MTSPRSSSMISRISSIMILITCIFLTSANAFAQDADQPVKFVIRHPEPNASDQPANVFHETIPVPDNEDVIINVRIKNRRSTIVNSEPAPMLMASQDMESQLDYKSIQDRSGFMMSFGIGYGGFVGFGSHISLGYNFNSLFALSLEANASIGVTSSADIAIVPKLQLPYRSFRLTLGLGIGLLWSWPYYEDIESSFGYQIKPQIQFDWYVNEHYFVGLLLETPIGFYMKDTMYNGHSYCGEHAETSIAYANFHFGYKF